MKRDNGVRPPKILGQIRKGLKFIDALPAKCLKSVDINEDSSDAERMKILALVALVVKVNYK